LGIINPENMSKEFVAYNPIDVERNGVPQDRHVDPDTGRKFIRRDANWFLKSADVGKPSFASPPKGFRGK
jgi:hypothetical protein